MQERRLYRRQLLAENAAVLGSTLVFSKLVLFTRFPALNLPAKLVLLYAYSATLDPLAVLAGYWVTRAGEQARMMVDKD